MNVLLLTQSLSTTKGGGEYTFGLIAKLLAEDGHKVWVVTNNVKHEKYYEKKNLKIIFVPPQLELKAGEPPLFKNNVAYCFYTFIKSIYIIRKNKIDIIHSNNFAPALTGSFLSIFTGRPHITTIHHVSSHYKDFWKKWGKQENISKMSVILGPIFEKMIMKLKCSAIHTVSEASKESISKLGTKKPIYVIPNAYETNFIPTFEPVPYQFIYIGRLLFYKNIEVVIRSITILKNNYPKIKLIIAGDGPLKKNLQKLVLDLGVENNVLFTGYISEDEKKRLLSMSQALVFPSLLEGFGMVILEAFEAEKPVLVSNIRPLSDIVENEITGIIISSLAVEKWVKAFEQIINDPKKAREMGKAGRTTLNKKYSPSILQKKILEMYSDYL